MLRHGSQPLIADPLAVLGTHRRIDVSHDGIDGNLVLRLTPDGSEYVPKRIKPQTAPAVDTGSLSSFETLRESVQRHDCSQLVAPSPRLDSNPSLAGAGQKYEPGIGGMFGLGTLGDRLPQCVDCLGPQRDASLNRRFRTWEIEPAASQVDGLLRQVGDIGVAESGIKPQHDHHTDLRIGRIEDPVHLVRGSIRSPASSRAFRKVFLLGRSND